MNTSELIPAQRLTDDFTDALYDAAQRVETQRDFARFVERLAEDFETNREVWENLSIPDFLLALADCTRRSAGPQLDSEPSVDAESNWSLMARLLLGASVMR